MHIMICIQIVCMLYEIHVVQVNLNGTLICVAIIDFKIRITTNHILLRWVYAFS